MLGKVRHIASKIHLVLDRKPESLQEPFGLKQPYHHQCIAFFYNFAVDMVYGCCMD
jgi:hypothetical protein